MTLFNLYWRFLGLPLSRLKGVVTDALPFSVVEAALWLGAIAALLWLVAWRRKWAMPRLRRLLAIGPVLLAILGLGQGALPISLAPSAWRPSLSQGPAGDTMGEAEFKTWVADREQRLARDLPWEGYRTLSEGETLAACDQSLDTVLRALGLPPGRTVGKVKGMGPVTTVLGLAYGGPAFHDPFTGELGMVKAADLPTSRHWRLIASCHEAAHAKGFMREMDAEILTQLALLRIDDPRFQCLADIHFLGKSGLEIRWPDSLQAESRRARAARKEVEERQPVVVFLKRWAERLHMRNSGAKYGDRDKREAWNSRHPFFSAVYRLQAKVRAGEGA